MISRYFDEFVTLWVVIDPIGTIPIFLSVTGNRRPEELRRIATRACLIAAVVLIVFMGIGQVLLNAIGVSIASFKIAGGLILFKFALSMIFASDSHSAPSTASSDPAVFPVAIPAIAGPGTILASVVLTDNDRFSYGQQAGTAVTLCVVLFVQWVLLMLATPIQRRLGTSGTSILSRVMGLVLAALAVETALDGGKAVLASWGIGS